MKLFKCQNCGQILYFENSKCERCAHALGFDPAAAQLYALEPVGQLWQRPGDASKSYRFCANAGLQACNWLIDAAEADTLCVSCRHNRTIPDLAEEARLVAWRKLEIAKHRLFYSLLRLGLPTGDRPAEPVRHLAFDFLAEASDTPRVMTGHDNGLITIALSEADDVQREKNRTALHEPYRTLLGHFRHEIGHYYWDRLVDDGGRLDDFRALFGDETADYGQALEAHYRDGPPADWQASFVSAYATSHPWEDFAETWAHYLHIVDTLEIARAFGMSIHPTLVRGDALDANIDFDPYGVADVHQLVDTWLPLSLALNSLNRAMGQADLYPFVLSEPVVVKLGFIHDIIRAQRAGKIPAQRAGEPGNSPGHATPAPGAR